MNEESDKKYSFFIYILVAECLIALLLSFYFFYLKKDYDFIVEVACDSEKETCFSRDCSEVDSCPPNNLETFKRYVVKARDFYKCDNEDCLLVCETEKIQCELLPCVEDELLGESCVNPQSAINLNE